MRREARRSAPVVSVLRSCLAAAVAAFLVLALAPPAGAIFHGTPVDPASAPWFATLLGRGPVCGGALVAPDRVLTAAHCVAGADPSRLRLRLGGESLRVAGVRADWRGASFPRSYREVPSPVAPDDPAAAATVDDVAVLLLERPATGVPVLPLAATPPAVDEATLTVGHGRTGPVPRIAGPGEDPTRSSDLLLGARQVAVGEEECRAAYAALYRPGDHLCTLDRSPAGAAACAGDSGSPVLVERDGVLQLAGVVTWGGETQGRDCGQGLPDVSERVAPHAGLIAAVRPALAPWAERRVRVRLRDGAARCVIGAWGGTSPAFAVRWFRPGRIVTEDPGDGAAVRIRRTPDRLLPHRGRILRASRGPVGCLVTATTRGGRVTERSYNAVRIPRR